MGTPAVSTFLITSVKSLMSHKLTYSPLPGGWDMNIIGCLYSAHPGKLFRYYSYMGLIFREMLKYLFISKNWLRQNKRKGHAIMQIHNHSWFLSAQGQGADSKVCSCLSHLNAGVSKADIYEVITNIYQEMKR